MEFKLNSDFKPKGDQPAAIDTLAKNLSKGVSDQVLLGVTGSGKTFTLANVIERVQKPTLVFAPNKTLAAQLYNEFKFFFPENAVEYFVSYYDYYQPEAYLPKSDTFIEKDSAINDEIEKLRHSATRSLLERRDVLIVASVSCIYGIGSPDTYYGMMTRLATGQKIGRDDLVERLVAMQYERNNIDFARGTFRVNGDVLEIIPIYESETGLRIEFFGDEIDSMSRIDPITGDASQKLTKAVVYPASHYVTTPEILEKAMESIRRELIMTAEEHRRENRLVECQRLEQRTMFDLEMMKETGYCNGIENYSRYLTGRKAGEPPPTLLDYFPADSLVIIDESHVSIGQLRGMHAGDRARKETLVRYGFRLPSALDNRPLSFDEFEKDGKQRIYVSATPGDYELKKVGGRVTELVIRPTGLVDPPVSVRPVSGQVDDLIHEVKLRAAKDERTLVTTLTKRFAEDLTDYFRESGVRVKYMHSDIETLERTEILRELRLGEFDALIGINLLREGLDLPEVSLVAILDADKEGYLRSQTSLIQTAGRAARNSESLVIMYADKITGSMERAMAEMERRRKIQIAYNKEHKITPKTIKKRIYETMSAHADDTPVVAEEEHKYHSRDEIARLIRKLESEMKNEAQKLNFERAAECRDKISELRKVEILYA
ncbi:MAG: excinuclease ABC subunit UvrB [Nitrospinae bacterium]|nr:excinuclease ABC subunit UvrB [Nitrospinota bacterium]